MKQMDAPLTDMKKDKDKEKQTKKKRKALGRQ